jgi:hypothetical protein
MQKLEVEGPGGKKAVARLRAAEVRPRSTNRVVVNLFFLINDDRIAAVSPRHHDPTPHPPRNHPAAQTQAALEARESPYLSPAMKATVAMLESGARVKRKALAATTELVRVEWLSRRGWGERVDQVGLTT